MKYIQTLHEGDDIQEIYLCKQVRYLETKTGKEYVSLILTDRTGDLDAKIWDSNPGIGEFDAKDYIRVTGKVTSFNSLLQLNIRRVQRCSEGEYDPADYVPTTGGDIDQMFHTLLGFISRMEQPHLKALLEEFFVKDESFIRAFKKSSAAKGVHHAFMGGLLEHTLSVTENCAFFAKKYPLLQEDLLIAAALCHDIGKTRELSEFPENDYTDDGNLIGHIVLGAEMVSEKIKEIPDFPPTLASQLRHCILAHHGELEYGSPKKPALAEAVALNFADNIDAKMETMKELFAAAENSNSETKSDWLGYQRLFESNVRKTTMEG